MSSSVIKNKTLLQVSGENVQKTLVPTATLTDLISITLPYKGMWLVKFVGDWGKNGNGDRYITTDSNIFGGRENSISAKSVSVSDTYMEMIRFVEIRGADTTLTLRGYQNSGEDLYCYPYAYAVKLSD